MRMCRSHLLDGVEPWRGPACVRPGTIVQQVRYDEQTERVFLQPRRWLHLPRVAWELVVGTHQVLAAWLLARRGLRLGREDIEHLLRTVQAMVSTVEQAAAVDMTIERHGGWGEAFDGR